MLVKDKEYQDSDECVAENLIANDYEFTADGKRFVVPVENEVAK